MNRKFEPNWLTLTIKYLCIYVVGIVNIYYFQPFGKYSNIILIFLLAFLLIELYKDYKSLYQIILSDTGVFKKHYFSKQKEPVILCSDVSKVVTFYSEKSDTGFAIYDKKNNQVTDLALNNLNTRETTEFIAEFNKTSRDYPISFTRKPTNDFAHQPLSKEYLLFVCAFAGLLLLVMYLAISRNWI